MRGLWFIAFFAALAFALWLDLPYRHKTNMTTYTRIAAVTGANKVDCFFQ